VRERLHGIRVIRAFNREEQEQGRIAEATRVMAEHIIEANTKMGLVAPIAIALMNLWRSRSCTLAAAGCKAGFPPLPAAISLPWCSMWLW